MKRRSGDGGINPYPPPPKVRSEQEHAIVGPFSGNGEDLSRKATLKRDLPELRTIYRTDQFTGETVDCGIRPRNPLTEKWRSQSGDPGEGEEEP